jgi:hypothetical protein
VGKHLEWAEWPNQTSLEKRAVARVLARDAHHRFLMIGNLDVAEFA